MKDEIKENLLIYLICIAIVILTIAVVLNIIFLNQKPEPKQSLNENLNCSAGDIFNTSHCLRNELSEFFKYNISQIGKSLNLSQLKESGGVCDHYSKFYKDNFIKLGAREVEQRTSFKFEATKPLYYVSEVIFPTDNKTSHVVTIVSNNEGYCVLDQMTIKCWDFR